jgi:hypothetical protein
MLVNSWRTFAARTGFQRENAGKTIRQGWPVSEWASSYHLINENIYFENYYNEQRK